MGLFAFRRLRERQAASTEVAFLSVAEPTIEPTEPEPDGNHDRSNSRKRKLKLVPDAS
jgi:hypothetical protein